LPSKIVLTTATVALSLLCACSKQETQALETAAPVTTEPAAESVYVAAVQHPGRTAADRERDAGRRPAEVMEFFGIEPGMDILDMFSGGGYYTEILSRVVGAEGSVVAHTNQAYAQFVGEEATNRFANDRLANVDILMAENDALEMPNEAFDVVMMILAYHDIYYVSPDSGWPKIDGPALVSELFDALRPGGMVAVVDHHAAAGSPSETGNSLHRIDPQLVIAEMESAGFVFEEQSDVLRNMADDHSLHMSAAEIRGKTDRFVYRFRKPE
jgi:predicted methyltransferase